MESPPCDIPIGLAELIDERIRNLLDKLHGSFSVTEVQKELRELDLLLGSFRQKDEQLEKLLSERNAKYERAAMITELHTQRQAILNNRETLELLHQESHRLMLQSARLIAESKRRFEKLARIHGDYASEMCAHCKGVGGGSEAPCRACRGAGTVLVHQPSLKCPRCNGEGQYTNNAIALFHSDLCLVCQGTGWVMVLHRPESWGRGEDLESKELTKLRT